MGAPDGFIGLGDTIDVQKLNMVWPNHLDWVNFTRSAVAVVHMQSLLLDRRCADNPCRQQNRVPIKAYGQAYSHSWYP